MTRQETNAAQRPGKEADLVQLTDELTIALEKGEPFDFDAFVAAHVEHEHQLRHVFPAIQALVGLGMRDDASGGAAGAGNEAATERTLGDFRIVRELGRGGMGVVYEAEQIFLGRQVALKVLPMAAALSPQQLERFKNEARAAATLKHPHIVGVYSVGVERGVHYYAMELIEGRSLAQVVSELRDEPTPGGLSSNEVAVPAGETTTAAALSTVRTTNLQQYYRKIAKIVGDAAEALDYAHNRGVLHRDIKPANLLIDANSHVWITDFGLARLEADAGVTLTGDILGTLRYMSPEQAAGKAALVDYRTDIHALGATLFELLSLHPAFPGNDRAELLRQVAETTPPSLRKIVPRLPVDLETIVAKALEKDPADRYQSAGEMAADLRAFIEHRAITAKPPSLAARAQKWMRRHVAIVTLALTALVLIAALLGVALTSIHRARSETVAALENAQNNLQFARLAVDQMYADVATEWLADELALYRAKPEAFQTTGLSLWVQVMAGCRAC
jgi:eukaryotic-like serine/threonine-protein kinase